MLNGKKFRARCTSVVLTGGTLLVPSTQAAHAQGANTSSPIVSPSQTVAETAVNGTLSTVEVVATTPLGAPTSPLDIPSETQTITSQEIGNLRQTTLQDALARRMPGVSVTDAIGSPLSESVDFRGETASSVPGTPQGLAVYMNGVRINEAYGDVVNWDLIPQFAIDTAQIVTGNPVFGLNALAGAVVLNMKNGFTWQGTEFNLQGGTDYTAQGDAQYGIQKGNWAYYVAMEGVRTNGYRFFGQSDAERGFADIGYRAEGNEVHVSVTGGADGLGVAGTTPLALVEQNPAAVFTTPQTTNTTAEMVILSDESHITPTLTFNGNAYFRSYAQMHVDGHISNFYSCGSVTVCNQNDAPGIPNGTPIDGTVAGTAALGDPLAGAAAAGTPLGEIDRNWTRTYSTGATAQLTDTDKLFGHENTVTAGISVDHGWTHWVGASTLGALPPDFIVTNSNEYINEPLYDVSPVNVRAQNTYAGVFVLDDFALTDRLTLHAGARFNDAQIRLADLTGVNPNLNASNNFNRINPVAGVTFKITPDIAAYASYSEANRAPTPLELGCASPSNPCMIDSFLVSDPPLKQIVARTVEAGFKGMNEIAGVIPGRFDWSVSLYRTENQNDIYSVPSPTVIGLGYYTNAGDTLLQGIDLGATYTTDRWDVYANYSYLRATFLTPVRLSSKNNPYSVGGSEQVEPGDNLPGIPRHKFTIGFDYELLPRWKVGADLVYRSGVYYFGDEINALPQIPGFASLNLRTSYQVNKNVEIYGLINNALDYRGASYGALWETNSTQNQATNACIPGLFCSSDPRAVTIAPPFEAFVGLKVAL